MRRWVAVAALAFAPGAAAQSPAADLAAFGWFASLAGACWKGEHPDGGSSDTQCYEAQYGRVIRGTIKVAVVREGATTLFEGDSVFAPDPASRRILYTQWGSNASYGTGEMVAEGEVLRFQNRPRDGGEASVRFLWTKIDADTYRITRERRDDSGWKEDVPVVYRRVR
jgi:hypothetical protein